MSRKSQVSYFILLPFYQLSYSLGLGRINQIPILTLKVKGNLRIGRNFILGVKKQGKHTAFLLPPSSRATVHIQVNDVNEYAPVFKEKSYKATVVEGKQYDSILRVEAVDADCSPQFSQICSYEIVTPDVPFAVDKDGEHRGAFFPHCGGDGVGSPSMPIGFKPKLLSALR